MGETWVLAIYATLVLGAVLITVLIGKLSTAEPPGKVVCKGDEHGGSKPEGRLATLALDGESNFCKAAQSPGDDKNSHVGPMLEPISPLERVSPGSNRLPAMPKMAVEGEA